MPLLLPSRHNDEISLTVGGTQSVCVPPTVLFRYRQVVGPVVKPQSCRFFQPSQSRHKAESFGFLHQHFLYRSVKQTFPTPLIENVGAERKVSLPLSRE